MSKVIVEFNGLAGLGSKITLATARAVADAANICVEEASSNVHVITGDLRSTIRAEVEGLTAVVSAGGLPGGATGDDVDYAAHEEFGTRYRAGHPFMGPAAAAADESLKNAGIRNITLAISDPRLP